MQNTNRYSADLVSILTAQIIQKHMRRYEVNHRIRNKRKQRKAEGRAEQPRRL